jgi:hypothetical protein
LHRTLLKGGRQLRAAFQKVFAKISEMYETTGRKELTKISFLDVFVLQ